MLLSHILIRNYYDVIKEDFTSSSNNPGYPNPKYKKVVIAEKKIRRLLFQFIHKHQVKKQINWF